MFFLKSLFWKKSRMSRVKLETAKIYVAIASEGKQIVIFDKAILE